MYKRNIFLAALALLSLVSCKEKFVPNLPSPGAGYLVVEGNLTAGLGSTDIRISRTFPLDGNGLQMEKNARVVVEGSDGSNQLLPMTSDGHYTSPQLLFTTGSTYKLRIKTTDGKEYLSDALSPITTPAIDSVGWKRDENGIEFYVNAKGTNNDSRYYRWEFDETWEIRSFFYSLYLYEPPKVRPRVPPQEMVFYCWKYGTSTSLYLGSTAALTSNTVHEKVLHRIPPGDERLSVRYSIMLRQYSLSREAYDFYELMKKNTELLGSVFDVQPSELRGNIHCINDNNAIAIGFVTAATVSSKRIFVDRPVNWGFNEGCQSFTVVFDSLDFYFNGGSNIPIEEAFDPETNAKIGYLGSAARCVDCTTRGGNKQKPSYW